MCPLLAPAPRIDPRIQRTRQAIQAAFQTLLGARGLEGLTVQDITAQAGVNRATFYAHYRGKHDLFAQLLQDHLDAVVVAPLTRPLRVDETGLRALLLTLCGFMTQVHEQCHVHDDEMEVQIERQVLGQVTEWLSEAVQGRAQAVNSRLVSSDTAATLIASSLYTAAVLWGRGQVAQPLEAYVSEVLVFVLGGVSACGFGHSGTRG